MRAPQRAAVFVALAWGAPLLLSLVEGRAFGDFAGRPFLLDFGAWARLFIAVGLMVMAEQQVEEGLRRKIRQFVLAPLLAPSAFAEGAAAVAAALKRRSSGVAELICLLLALGGCAMWFEHLEAAQASNWAVDVSGAGARVTLAGWWTVVVGSTIFNFLLLRGVWRYICWAILIWRIASLELRLVASHPDGKAGLGFIADYPNAYSMFVFGLSAAVAIAVVRHVFENGITQVTFGYIVGGWLAIVLAFFGFPLIAFIRPLSDLREKALEILSADATRFHRQAERALLGKTSSPTIPRKPPWRRSPSTPPRNMRSRASCRCSC